MRLVLVSERVHFGAYCSWHSTACKRAKSEMSLSGLSVFWIMALAKLGRVLGLDVWLGRGKPGHNGIIT